MLNINTMVKIADHDLRDSEDIFCIIPSRSVSR